MKQDFFDEVAEFLNVNALSCYDKMLVDLSDFSFLAKLNFSLFFYYYDRFDPSKVTLSIIKKASCCIFYFLPFFTVFLKAK